MKKNQVRLTAVAMQFVFNHTTFDPDDEMDQAALASYCLPGSTPTVAKG